MDIFIAKEDTLGAMEGHKVVVKLLDGQKVVNAEGEVTQILGHKNDPGVDIFSIIHKHGLPLNSLKKLWIKQMQFQIKSLKRILESRRDLTK